MERTLETITINNALEVVRLKGELKFKHPLGYTRPSGYCFKHPVKGLPASGIFVTATISTSKYSSPQYILFSRIKFFLFFAIPFILLILQVHKGTPTKPYTYTSIILYKYIIL